MTATTGDVRLATTGTPARHDVLQADAADDAHPSRQLVVDRPVTPSQEPLDGTFYRLTNNAG